MTLLPAPNGGGQFSQCDLDRLVAETFVVEVDYHPQLDSTNDRALQLARSGDPLPGAMLVLADRQTAGRGRGNNRWWSGEGALTFSLLLPNKSLALPSVTIPQTSLLAGLAVAAAVERLVPGETAQLKWPNDVYLRRRKLCGILTEAISGSAGALVIGIGVNVSNSFSDAPQDVREAAISLVEVATASCERIVLLIAILQQLELQLKRLRAGDSQLQQQWQDRCLLTGQTLQLDTPGRQLVGICRGIDEQGALLLEVGKNIERCVSGTVTLIS
jgi:BirA family biotin operon repressor/biotin-[acetyl-CoA-carboxylase] ligase